MKSAERPIRRDQLEVHELEEAVSAAVAERFGSCQYVRGEVTQRQRVKGNHLQFSIASKGCEVRCILFGNEEQKVNQAIRHMDASAESLIDTGNRVVVGGRVTYDPPYGLEIRVSFLDGRATLGEIAHSRDQVRGRLSARGLAPQSLSLPDWPLRVGLVSGRSAEGHGDFVSAICSTGYRIQLIERGVALAGADAAPQISSAIQDLVECGVDAIAVVRGGSGSKVSFAPFYDEDVVAAIAQCPVPVLCGIGHHSDQTLAEQYCAMPCTTPSAAAAKLVAHVRDRELALLGVIERCCEKLAQARGRSRKREWVAWLVGIGTSAATIATLNFLGLRMAALTAGCAFVLLGIGAIYAARPSRGALEPELECRTLDDVWHRLHTLEAEAARAGAARAFMDRLRRVDHCRDRAYALLYAREAVGRLRATEVRRSGHRR